MDNEYEYNRDSDSDTINDNFEMENELSKRTDFNKTKNNKEKLPQLRSLGKTS
jgi:hypothetical protein